MEVIIGTIRIESEIGRLDDQIVSIEMTNRVSVLKRVAGWRVATAIHPDCSQDIVGGAAKILCDAVGLGRHFPYGVIAP